MRKCHLCAFAVLILWQFSEKIKKLVPRIPFSFFDSLLALRRRLKNQKTIFSKSESGLFFWEELGGEKVWVASITFQMTFWVLRKIAGLITWSIF